MEFSTEQQLAYNKYIESLNDDISKYTTEDILSILDGYKKNILLDMKNTEINWSKYEDMVGKLNSSYLKIIKVLNSKIQNKNTISNFFINLLKTKPIIPEQINNFEKYFTLIFDNIFADYWDLDRYEDSDYNVLNKSIIQILRINVISIIKIETINTISNYMVQITTSLKNDKIIDIGQIIKDIKSKKVSRKKL